MPRPIELCVALAATLIVGAAPLACSVFGGLEADGGYLDVSAASRLCAHMFDCPTLAPSLRASLGVPADDQSFSACLSWFAGPVAAELGVIRAGRKVLANMAAAASCGDALAFANTRVLGEGETGCDEASDECLSLDADFEQLACARCGSELFASGSTCFPSSDASGPRGRCGKESCDVLPFEPAKCGDSSTLELCDPRAKARQHFDCSALGLKCAPVAVEPIGEGSPEDMAICISPGNEVPVCGASWRIDLCGGEGNQSIVLCNRELHVKIPAKPFPKTDAKELSYALIQTVYHCPASATCEDAAAGTSIASCRRRDAACSAGDDELINARCDGASFTVCLAGRIETIDCAASGATCSDDGARGAHCTFL